MTEQSHIGGDLSSIVEQNIGLKDRVRKSSDDLKTGSDNYGHVNTWAQDVRDVSGNLLQQQKYGRQLGSYIRLEEDDRNNNLRQKYEFLCSKVKADIKIYTNHLLEFLDLEDNQNTVKGGEGAVWETLLDSIDQTQKKIPLQIENINEIEALTDLTSLIRLLNLRESVQELLLKGALYKKSVLDWDLNVKKDFTDHISKEINDLVLAQYGRHQLSDRCVTGKLSIDISKAVPTSSVGNYEKKKQPKTVSKGGHMSKKTADFFPHAFVASIKEITNMDKMLRTKFFGVGIVEVDASANVKVAAAGLRDEITLWYKKCVELDNELQSLKAKSNLSHQIDSLQANLQAKEERNRRLTREKNIVEAEMTRMGHERNELGMKLKDITEKYHKVTVTTVPRLEKMEEMLDNNDESITVLKADADMLSSMFRKQVANTQTVSQQATIYNAQIASLNEELREATESNKLLREELEKKQSLIYRVMGARKEMVRDYEKLRQQVQSSTTTQDEACRQRDKAMELLKDRDKKVEGAILDLSKANIRIDELEQQLKYAIGELSDIRGGAPFVMRLMAYRSAKEPTSMPPLSIERLPGSKPTPPPQPSPQAISARASSFGVGLKGFGSQRGSVAARPIDKLS